MTATSQHRADAELIAPAKRAYSVADWQRDFVNAFGPTQARGSLLAADNDEPEPVKSFKQIDDEASAEQRAIVRGVIAAQSNRATSHAEERRAGFDSSPGAFPCRADLEGDE
jgi:hypothetical protein